MAHHLSDIVSYFRYLCEQHSALQHNEAAGSRVFEVRSYDEAFGDFRSAATEKGYAVRLILPTISMRSQGNQAYKSYEIGLLVLRYIDRRNDAKSALTNAMSDAEAVADDFIARIVQDSRNGYPLFHHSVDQVSNLQVKGDYLEVEGDGSYAGVLYMFNFETFRGLDTSCASAEWLDEGLTPLPD